MNWATTAIASGASGAQAIEFCRSAATASDTCEKRITSVDATEKVTITSKPFFGAEVTIDGEPAGKTPLNQVELPFGAHEVRLRLGETESTRTIQVGAGTPKRWTWNSEENEWSSGL